MQNKSGAKKSWLTTIPCVDTNLKTVYKLSGICELKKKTLHVIICNRSTKCPGIQVTCHKVFTLQNKK